MKNMNDLGKKIIDSALSLGAKEAEVFIINSKNTKITVRDFDVEDIHQANEQGLALRIFKDNKLGFHYSTNLDINNINNISKSAIDNALENEADEYNFLNNSPEKITIYPDIYDQQLIDTPISDKIELTKSIEKTAKSTDKRVIKTEYVSFDETIHNILLINSHCFENNYKGTVCGGMAELIAEENGSMETGFGFLYSTHISRFDPVFVGKEAEEDAVSMLCAPSIDTASSAASFPTNTGSNLLI